MTELNMDYNSERPDLVIPEYGRNIQRMVEFAVTIKSRELRNQVALAIINVMGQLFPHLRDEEKAPFSIRGRRLLRRSPRTPFFRRTRPDDDWRTGCDHCFGR